MSESDSARGLDSQSGSGLDSALALESDLDSDSELAQESALESDSGSAMESDPESDSQSESWSQGLLLQCPWPGEFDFSGSARRFAT